MIITHGTAQYRVGKLVALAGTYRLYLCDEVATGRQCLLQIAAATEFNAGLERAAFILKELKRASDLLEAEYAKISDRKLLNYDRLFPILVDSFVVEEQGGRRVIILVFKDVAAVTEMAPLSNLRVIDQTRIDLKTSAWIMGRILKLLVLCHGQGIAVTVMTGNNVLIEPEEHLLVVLDWSSARIHQGVPPESKDDIALAAQAVFVAIGGDPNTGHYPYEVNNEQPYIDLLWRFASRRQGDAKEAHRQFYELVRGLFGRNFHPFHPLPL